MGQRPNELTPDRSALHRWGYELRELRTLRRLSLRRLAEKVHIDASHLARFERAERAPSDVQVKRLDAALGAEGALVGLWEETVSPLPEPEPESDAEMEGALAAWRKRVSGDVAAGQVRGEVVLHLRGRAAADGDLARELVGRLRRVAREPRYQEIVVGVEWR